MPTDYQKLSDDLRRFYDFSGKTVLYIGAGGRQLLDPVTPTRKLIAVDQDQKALHELKASIAARKLSDLVEVIAARFEDVIIPADTVYFEFCLHEMTDPEETLLHARSLAQEIVVFDHAPGSDWSYQCAEEDKVTRSHAAMERFGIRRHEAFELKQQFANHAELLAKVGSQGRFAIDRALPFANVTGISISMPYELALL